MLLYLAAIALLFIGFVESKGGRGGGSSSSSGRSSSSSSSYSGSRSSYSYSSYYSSSRVILVAPAYYYYSYYYMGTVYVPANYTTVYDNSANDYTYLGIIIPIAFVISLILMLSICSCIAKKYKVPLCEVCACCWCCRCAKFF